MTNITIIAAIGKNNELGKDNNLIWYLPEDLKFFKSVTIGHPVVMGSNTLRSLPRKLKDRPYIVLTTKDLEVDSDVTIVHNLNELLEYINTLDDEVMVIGGASIYNQLMEYANTMYLTEVEEICEDADCFFPTFNKDEWNIETLSEHTTEDGIKYKHKKYTK